MYMAVRERERVLDAQRRRDCETFEEAGESMRQESAT